MVWALVAFSTVLFRSVTYIATASLWQRNAIFAKKETKSSLQKLGLEGCLEVFITE
jgi:hypothetical protein